MVFIFQAQHSVHGLRLKIRTLESFTLVILQTIKNKLSFLTCLLTILVFALSASAFSPTL